MVGYGEDGAVGFHKHLRLVSPLSERFVSINGGSLFGIKILQSLIC